MELIKKLTTLDKMFLGNISRTALIAMMISFGFSKIIIPH
jgi:hypothetical protein